MKILKKKKKNRLNSFTDWVFSILAYSLVLLIVTSLFDRTISIDTSNYGMWYLISSIVIYILNKLVKPLLVWITLPLTGMTMGLFYPFINVIILYITDLLLKSHFEIRGIIMALIVAIIISLINLIINKILIKPLTRKER